VKALRQVMTATALSTQHLPALGAHQTQPSLCVVAKHTPNRKEEQNAAHQERPQA